MFHINYIFLFSLIISYPASAGEKPYIKSKDPAFFKPKEDLTLMYFMHKDYIKKKQYIAIDKSPRSILPNDCYTAFLVRPGWHLLSVSDTDCGIIESYEIYCYPGETQVINLVRLPDGDKPSPEPEPLPFNPDGSKAPRNPEDILDKKKNKSYLGEEKTENCHQFFLDRYTEKDLRIAVDKDKLDFVETTKTGRAKILKHLDECVKDRNKRKVKKFPHLKTTFKEAVADYQLPADPPAWSDEREFIIHAAPGDVSLMKLGLRKKSNVLINKNGIKITNEKKPERDMLIAFENITGFERIRPMGQFTMPFYLKVNYVENAEEKAVRFFTGNASPYVSTYCYDKSYMTEDEYENVKKADNFNHSLNLHRSTTAGYHELKLLNDIAFWWERQKAGK